MKVRAVWTKNVPEAVQRAVERADPVVVDLLDRIVTEGDSTLSRLAPIGPTGNYRRSVQHWVYPSELAAEFGATAKHSHLVEEGRRPGKPPPLSVAYKMGATSGRQAFNLARAIGRRGTRALRPVATTRKRLNVKVAAWARQTADELGALDKR